MAGCSDGMKILGTEICHSFAFSHFSDQKPLKGEHQQFNVPLYEATGAVAQGQPITG